LQSLDHLMRVIRHRYFRRVSNSLQRSDASDRRLTDILCAGNRLTGTTCSSVRCASMTQNESCDAMPRKRRVRKRPTGVSGLAANAASRQDCSLRHTAIPEKIRKADRGCGAPCTGNPGLETKNQDAADSKVEYCAMLAAHAPVAPRRGADAAATRS
jgi:hypothetical protein